MCVWCGAGDVCVCGQVCGEIHVYYNELGSYTCSTVNNTHKTIKC